MKRYWWTAFGGKAKAQPHPDLKRTNQLRHVGLYSVYAFSDGMLRLADISPNEVTVYGDENDWGVVGGDFRVAINNLIASDERLQPKLPFEDDDVVEAE